LTRRPYSYVDRRHFLFLTRRLIPILLAALIPILTRRPISPVLHKAPLSKVYVSSETL
jgi:hypothetical protein